MWWWWWWWWWGVATRQLPAPALTALLRRGRTFLDRFMKVMPFLSAHFLGHQEEILSTFKSLQQATRTLQALCAHSKVLLLPRPLAWPP
jgi:hypothetical protein